jgi:hypothetical protein
MQMPLYKVPHLRYAEMQGKIPPMKQIILNRDIGPFSKTRFYLHRKLTDLPGLVAFNNPLIAYLAYFSSLAGLLHRLLYLVREPFYDYDKYVRHQGDDHRR